MLTKLSCIKEITKELELEVIFSDLQTNISGPVGSRKTFMLDLLWYGITGMWASYPAQNISSIKIETSSSKKISKYSRGEWTPGKNKLDMSVIYLRDDRIGIFDSVCPPIIPKIFEHDAIYQKTNYLAGLLYDWVNWSYNDELREEISFVIQKLFRGKYLGLARGHTRINFLDARYIPQLSTKDGNVSVLHQPYHTRKILALIYILFKMREDRLAAENLLGHELEKDSQPLLLLIDGIQDFCGISLLENIDSLSSILNTPLQLITTTRTQEVQ